MKSDLGISIDVTFLLIFCFEIFDFDIFKF